MSDKDRVFIPVAQRAEGISTSMMLLCVNKYNIAFYIIIEIAYCHVTPVFYIYLDKLQNYIKQGKTEKACCRTVAHHLLSWLPCFGCLYKDTPPEAVQGEKAAEGFIDEGKGFQTVKLFP